jgi:hypothetical protein
MPQPPHEKPVAPPTDRPFWWLGGVPGRAGGVRPVTGKAKASQVPVFARWWCEEGDQEWKRLPTR